jgi:hypothetical protein
MAGSNGHKPDCGCPLCRGKVRTAERERAEAEQEATVRAVARALVRLAAAGPLAGPDALRNLVGHDDALRVLRMAGVNPAQAAQGWEEAAPVQRQASAQLNSGYAGDPDHDERVTRALLHGVSDAELAKIRAEVRAEYAGRALERRRREDVYYGRDVMPAPAGVSVSERGIPRQRSVVHADVPPLGES